MGRDIAKEWPVKVKSGVTVASGFVGMSLEADLVSSFKFRYSRTLSGFEEGFSSVFASKVAGDSFLGAC